MKFFLFFISVLICLAGQGQFTLKGLVTEAGSKKNIAGASVFLSNTSIGTVTNNAGEFELAVPSGRFDLIVTFVGYETLVKVITGKTDEILKLEVTPKAQVLADVVVGSFEKNGWEKWGRLFTEFFVGTSELAERCSIKNYEALKFRHNKKQNKLTVMASEPLIIENKALGYTVQYKLEDFQYDFNGKFLSYYGFPLLIPMEGSNAKQNRWVKSREEAYYGSIGHFMRAIYNNKLKEEGFEVRRLVKTLNFEKKRVKSIFRNTAVIEDSLPYYNRIMEQPDENSTYSPYTLPGDSIAFAVDSFTAGLQFENYLHIYYPKKNTSLRYHNYSPRNDKAMSEVSLVEPEPLHIQSNGSYFSPLNFISNGYWAWSEKISSMLPFNYNPAIKPTSNKLKRRKK
jgi:hypothetical protein